MQHQLTDDNFLLYAAQNYNNISCVDVKEFHEDISKIKGLSKLFNRYMKSGALNDKLILNHLIILYNVFDREAITRILVFKLYNYLYYLKPFLILLGFWPDKVEGIGTDNETIISSEIPMDNNIVKILRKI